MKRIISLVFDRLMKRIRKWQRIFLLALLFLSVCAPIVLVSLRLKTLALEGIEDFVGDLSSIKFRADSLKLRAIEQEDAEGLKEPKLEVYRDQYISVVSYSKYTEREGQNLTTQNNHGSNLQIPRPVNETVNKMKDQLIRSTTYLSFATENNKMTLVKVLKQRIKEVERVLGDAKRDSQLKKSAFRRIRIMEATLSKANRVYPDCFKMVKRLQEMAESSYEQIDEQNDKSKSLIRFINRI